MSLTGADLTPESTVALDELIQLLNDNPNVTIELSAHCDYKGNDDYNLRLSQRRAESVVRYLIKGGIDSERLTPKGYGEQQPKTVTNFTLKSGTFPEGGRCIDRRVYKKISHWNSRRFVMLLIVARNLKSCERHINELQATSYKCYAER